MKTCSKCGATKPFAEFAIDRAKIDQRDSWCRTCRNAARRHRYNAKLGHEQQRSRDYYDANRDAVLGRRASSGAYQRWKERNPDGLWIQWLKAAHGIAPEQWAAMWAEQDGKCYICEAELSGNRSKVAIDHDHSCCGEKKSCGHCRRGLVHPRCNQWIGMLGENIALMRQALDNFERVQALTQALILTKPEQGELIPLNQDQAS